MEQYIGTKVIHATAMNLGDYNKLKGWKIPDNEDPFREGYVVRYSDSYTSWSPKEVFEESYQKNGELDFGHALHHLKQGRKVAKAGWNGKGMFLFLVNGSTFKVNRPPLLGIYPEGTEVRYHAHIDIKNNDGVVVPWNSSQADMLSSDWYLLEED